MTRRTRPLPGPMEPPVSPRWILPIVLLAACAPEQRERTDRIDLSDLPMGAVRPDVGEDLIDIYFTEPGIAPGEEVDPELDDALVGLINAATTTLDLCLYEFNLEAVYQAAVDAHDRGVVVRFVGDGDEIHDEGYEALVDAGVVFSNRKPRDRIMHNKFVVADGQVVWTGTTNISTNGVYRNNNASLLIESEALADEYAAEFEQMYTDGLFGRRKADVSSTSALDFRDDTLEFYFSPEHNPVDEVVALIGTAEHTLYFLIFSYTHPDIRDAMLAAQARGVEVVGIFDESQARGRYSVDEDLALAGLPVYIDGNKNASGFSGGKLHHKSMMVDGMVGDAPLLITGSFNWSKSATLYNDENVLALREPGLVRQYQREFCSRLEEATLHPDYAGPVPEPCEAMVDQVFINEFLPNPDGTDLGQEFIEVVNGSTRTVDLSGWTVGDRTNPIRHTFDGTLLAPGEGIVVFDRGDHSDVPGAINASSASLSLNNTGDTLVLATPEGEIIDRVEYGTSHNGVSWNRDLDGSFEGVWNRHDLVEGTIEDSSPGLRADGSPWVDETEEVRPVLIINEVLANPEGTDLGQEYVEILNVGEVAADLNGWALADLRDVRHQFDATSLAPGAALVIFDRGDHSDVPGAVLASTTQLSLTNSSETVTLYDETGAEHDQVTWNSASSGVSRNRADDGVAGTELVDHDEVSTTGLDISPGTRADGSDW